MGKKTFKEWCKEHKEEIILGAVLTALVGGTVGVILHDRKLVMEHRAKGEKIIEGLEKAVTQLPHETHRFVDEDIFTNIAPQLEDLVLEEGVDEGLIETVYTVSFPLGGDPKLGFYDVKKHVKILVQDMCDGCE